MASNLVASAAEEPDEDEKVSSAPPPPMQRPSEPGFFTIYKKGQGKWTRLGTVFAAVLLGALTVFNLYTDYLPPYVHSQKGLLGICAGFSIAFAVLVYWIVNKPTNVDFLIATDSEMKKVNWTTQGELMGSTRVVIIFLACIAVFLFLVDIVFAETFYLVKVLKSSPFQ